MIRKSTILAFLSALALSLNLAWGETQRVDVEAIESANVRNLIKHENNLFTGGQPTTEQLKILAQSGVKHVITLRPAAELNWNEGEFVKSLGMQFHAIPISDVDSINSENAAKMSSLLSELEGQAVLLHCKSGNRIGALAAISAKDSEDISIDDAIAQGKRWGLTRHEGLVRSKLSGN